MALIDSLADAFGRPVDLIDLRSAGEPLTGQILQGIRVHAGNDVHAALLNRHVFDREDFLPGRQAILEKRKQQWTESS